MRGIAAHGCLPFGTAGARNREPTAERKADVGAKLGTQPCRGRCQVGNPGTRGASEEEFSLEPSGVPSSRERAHARATHEHGLHGHRHSGDRTEHEVLQTSAMEIQAACRAVNPVFGYF
ncbi:Hypothetical protein AA314_06630 [Archangium gephyra]|uniref:Uncharacterized protein n=1 Tax=Archangium gephyra TaxID=48 RepID=A0AAC8QCR0_9BACT|nr:Hypothetical protein AA314_06630 [Archangium gephyra]